MHNGIAVTYDEDGNLLSGPTSASEPTNFVYNARNQLTSAAGGSNSTSTVYRYDALGNRIQQITDNSITNNYTINPNASLSQVLVRKKNGQKTFYVYGLGLSYEVNESGDATYYHYDLIGSTVALTDDSGTVTDRIEYSSYGTVTHRTSTIDTPFLYVGKYGVQTDANGLLYMRARYYSPNMRRFLNSDPIRFDGGLNFFAYANGNPLGYNDPTGLAYNKPIGLTIEADGTGNMIYYPGDIDSGQWDYYHWEPNSFGTGLSAPVSTEGEVAVVVIPIVAIGGTAAVMTAPSWSPTVLMWGGGLSLGGTRLAQQFFANNPIAWPAMNWLQWGVMDKCMDGPSKIDAAKWYFDLGANKMLDYFGPKLGLSGYMDNSGNSGPFIDPGDAAGSGLRGMDPNSTENNSLEAEATTIPVGGAGKTPKP